MPAVTLQRTKSAHPAFAALIVQLDADLRSRYGEAQQFFDQFNKVHMISQVVLASVDGSPVGCGAIKAFEPGVAEVKRMFVQPEHRGQGTGAKILQELERWALETGYHACVLETAKSQPEAIHLYQKTGYSIIPNYGPYVGVEISVCMRKELAHT